MRARFVSLLRLVFTLTTLALLALGCGDNLKPIAEDSGTPDVALSADKGISAFSFLAAKNAGLTNDVTATINGTTITATVPFGTNLTALVASFTFTGETIVAGTTMQVSGTTANNFTSPVTYTVTAEDGSAQNFLVTVTAAPSNAKAINTFVFEAADNPGVGGLTTDVVAVVSGMMISATVPFGTDVTDLVATFTTTGTSVRVGTVVQTSGTTANDFTDDVDYTVVAADNSTQVYSVTVNIAANTAKDITAFSFTTATNPNNPKLVANVIGTVGSNTISLTVPFGTIVTGLVATYSTSGASVRVNGQLQSNGVTANNFSSPVDYVVTAADGSTKTYRVTVTIAANTVAEITDFQFLSSLNPAIGGADVQATITGTAIVAIVPFNTDVSALKATFTATGTVTVTGVTQTSGVTVNSHSTVLTYLVTAADGITTQSYTVTVNNSNSSAKDITSFSILGQTGTINGTLITVTVSNTTALNALIPTIGITGVSVTPGSGVTNNFTTDATYVVRAADNTTKSYTVRVTQANISAKEITRFTINGLDAIIATTGADTGVITINVPNEIDRTTLTPDIDFTGVSLSPPNGTTRNFTNSVQYIVTAQDGSTRTYTVTVGTVNGNGTAIISEFSVLGIPATSITNGTAGTVTVVLPTGTDLTAQQPTIVINGASISPPSNVPQNFTSPVQYTVTASNGATHVYTVTVTAP